jgi:hypothetical protein
VSVNYVDEVDLDPQGYLPRPDLFARNLSRNTITFELGRVRWELAPRGETDYFASLPWTVAKSPGFTRVWAAGQVEVATDPDFAYPIYELPVVGAAQGFFRPYVHQQLSPQTVTVINHDLGRQGPVKVVMFSLDGTIEYTDFFTEMLDTNRCRVSTDDPLTFVATVF